MRENSKGFTLVELIATIVILGIIASIIIINVTSISKKSNDNEYESFRERVISSAQAYSSKESEIFNSLFVDRSFIYFTVGDLIDNGYLRDDLINPYTKEKIDPNGKIKAVLDSTTGAIRFDYPAENTSTEQYLVTQMDYVINGEPYDCMTGIGTYKLALSDEDGVLITDIDTLFNEYGLTCTYDSSMQVWTNSAIYGANQTIYGDKNHQIRYTNEAGDYTITYSWLTKSNSRMTATRQLRVLEKFEPSMELKVVTTPFPGNGHKANITNEIFDAGTSYEVFDSVNGNEKIYSLYTPQYNSGNWSYLAFKPSLVGADLDNTTFTITKGYYKSSPNYKTVNNSVVTIASNDSYDNIYVADDGEIEYTISTVTAGHYFKNYKSNSVAKIVLKQDIALNNNLIVDTSNANDITKIYNISDTYSPVGVKEYEVVVGTLPAGGRAAKPGNSTINRTGTVTTYTFNSSVNNTCEFVDKTYNYIFFRPINNDGYFGSWTQVNLNSTNNLSILINNNKGTDCTTTCSTNLSSSSTSLGTLTCYYCEKVKYISYNNKTYNILGMIGNNIVIADNEAYLGDVVGTDITTVKDDTVVVQTVDGPYSTPYQYTTTVAQNLFNKASLFESTLLRPGYNKVFGKKTYATDNQGDYLGYAAIPTTSDVSIFGNALDGEYWVAKNGESSTFEVTVLENVTETKSNYYWYYRKADGTLDIITGGTHPLKTMHLIDKGYVCSGDGSLVNPYVISMNN